MLFEIAGQFTLILVNQFNNKYHENRYYDARKQETKVKMVWV